MRYYIVDAFAEKIFEGNPAAVYIMDRWLSDEVMRLIAAEHNLSESAFAVREGEAWQLRWFTPGGEISLCGHATLATAFVITTFIEPKNLAVTFTTMSGELRVTRTGDLFAMDFPSYALTQIPVTDAMEQAIGVRPLSAWMGRDLLCVLDEEDCVAQAKPDMAKVLKLDGLLLHITAQGTQYDCVSRSFGPKCHIDEDPVCGSGHCHIAPFWADRLGKTSIVARQASRRGGTLYCTVRGERTVLAGRAVVYARGEACLEPQR